MAHSRELLRLLPRVLRARDFHLYLEGGKRITDLWLSGGRAVLGHKPPKVLGELKNAAERGLFVSFPHPMERRFFKPLGEFFPNHSFRLYMSESSLYRALEEAGFTGPFRDPAFPENDDKKERVSLWRPFLKTMTGLGSEETVLIPVLPWPLGPEVLVFEKSLENNFPQGELIPPVLLAPAARALYDLAAVMKARTFPRFQKIEKAVASSRWQRRGIYLTVKPEMDREEYAALFRNFLEGGFLIPPSQTEPLILPASMSDGEESKLAKILADSDARFCC